MDKFQEQQRQIFLKLADDSRLTSSAKRQIKLFVNILEQEPGIGFDTTSALLYGFLRNDEFTQQDVCPLTLKQKEVAKKISRNEARRDTAHETALLARVSRLPLENLFGSRIDLKDLAVSFLTYASDEPYFAYSYERNKKLYEYLDIPKCYYLNVYNLRHDFKRVGMSIDDFIVNLSRLRTKLWVPDSKFITIEFHRLIEVIKPKLPDALLHLTGENLENLVMELFEGEGYRVARVGRSIFEGDGGIDVIAYSQAPLAGDLRVAIQCKATKNKIEPGVIRAFNTSLQNLRSHKGVFVTTSHFTSGVSEEVSKSGYPIELMDYVKLSNRIRRAVIKS